MFITDVKPIEFDHRLDVNKALGYAPFKEIDTSTLPPLPDKWVDRLIDLCVSHLPEAEQDKLRKSFKSKLIDNIDYQFKGEMRFGVEIIYRRLIGQLDKALGALSDSAKSSIIVKLNEGVGQCVPGFHDRVGEILLSFQLPQNLQQVLFRVRMNLVKKMTYRLSDEVHAHNRCFVIARDAGYGVQPMNGEDIYRGGLKDTKIEAELEKIFASEYRAYQLPFLLCEELRGIFSNFGYEPGQPLKPETYDGIQKYLMELFGCEKGSKAEASSSKEEAEEDGSSKKETESQAISEESLNIFQLFLTDKEEESIVYDINTEYLSKLLYQVLMRQGVIRNDRNDLTAETSLIALAYYFRLGVEDQNFEQAKCILTKAKEPKEIECLVNELYALTTKEHAEYFKRLSKTTEFQNFLTSAKVEKNLSGAVKAFVNCDPSKDDIRTIGARAVKYLKLALLLKNEASFVVPIVRCIVNDRNVGWNVLMTAVKYYPEAVRPILDFMSEHAKEFGGESLQKIFSQTSKNNWNALMLAVNNHPEVIQPILDFMSTHAKEFGGESLQKIFSQASKNGWNALILAAGANPKAVQPILDFMSRHIEELGAECLQQIFSQIDECDSNALMRAAYSYPAAVQPILDFMSKHAKEFGGESLQQIFSQASKNGDCNALMLAADNHPEVIQPILDFMSTHAEKLGEKCLQKIFSKADKEIIRQFSERLKLKIKKFYNVGSEEVNSDVEKFYVVVAKLVMSKNEFFDLFIDATKGRRDWKQHLERALNPATVVGGFFATHRGIPIGETRSRKNIRKVYQENLAVINPDQEIHGPRMKI